MEKTTIGNWTKYTFASREEHIQIRRSLRPTEFNFTVDDCDSNPCKTWILKDVKPLIIFMGGSALTGTIDSDSDYDLTVITRDTARLSGHEPYLVFKERPIHAYIDTMDSMVNVLPLDIVTSTGLIKRVHLTKEKIIFSNIDEKTLDSFIEHKNDLFQIGALRYDEGCRQYITPVLEQKSFLQHSPIKFFATAIEIKYILKNEPVSKHLDYLTKIKRARRVPLSESDFKQLLTDLQEYCDLIDKYRKTHTIEEAVENWKSSYAYQAIMSDKLNS